MSPEIVQKKEYEGKPVDMWALGVLLFAMLTGTFPFRGVSEQDLYYKIQRGNFKVPDFVSKEAKRLIHKLLDVDYRRRMTAKDLVRDTWIRGGDLSSVSTESTSVMGVHRCQSIENRGSIESKKDFPKNALE